LQNKGFRVSVSQFPIKLSWDKKIKIKKAITGKQLNARLYRQGQKQTVVLQHLITEGTVDEDILRALEKKDNTQDAMINAVRARIGGMLDDSGNDDEGI